jgi:hypothetical protein
MHDSMTASYAKGSGGCDSNPSRTDELQRGRRTILLPIAVIVGRVAAEASDVLAIARAGRDPI